MKKLFLTIQYTNIQFKQFVTSINKLMLSRILFFYADNNHSNKKVT